VSDDANTNEPDSTGSRKYTALAQVGLSMGDLPGTKRQVDELQSSIDNLLKTLNTFATQSSTISQGFNKVFSAIQTGAQSSTQAAQQAAAAMGNASTSGAPTTTSSGAGRSLYNFGSSVFGTVNSQGWLRDLMLFPTRFMNDLLSNNRDLAMSAASSLGSSAFGSQIDVGKIMGAMSGNFGNVLGSPQELLNLQSIMRQVGAGLDWRAYNGTTGGGGNFPAASVMNGPRAAGFLTSVYQAQRMNPGTDVTTLAGNIASYTSNIGAQQLATFQTGGAFSMVGPGNQQKTISQWADGILKWLQDQRPGGNRGKAFTYGELMAQNWPGSNIDAWLTANGVPAQMKDYFWTYAMGKANAPSGQDIFTDQTVTQNMAYQNLQAVNAQSRSGFQLAGTMQGAYANKEQANRWFNELMGQMQNAIVPSAVSNGMLSFVQYLPDAIQQLLMQLSERTSIGSLGAGFLGWGSLLQGGSGAASAIGNAMQGGLNAIIPNGDVGDIGDYGSLGGTSSAGLHPDMRRRLDAMMAANPRLSVTSGLRDLGTQQRLRRQGVGRVSGRPSAHTRGMAADIGPSSQYPWIVANARRFGLKSGIGAGEPWHVGMGDIGDPPPDGKTYYDFNGNPVDSNGKPLVGTPNMSGQTSTSSDYGSKSTLSGGLDIGGVLTGLKGLFGNFGNLFSANPSNQIAGVAGGTTGILKMIMALFGGGAVDPSKLAFQDVYGQLVAGTSNALATGIISQGPRTQAGTPFTPPSNQSNMGGGGGSSMEDFFTQVLQQMGAPVTRNNLDKLAAVARQEGNVAAFNPWNFNVPITGSTIYGAPGSATYKAKIQNYPDWNSGVGLLATQMSGGNRAKYGITSNIMHDGSFSEFIADTNNYYHSWPNSGSINISQGSADQYLSRKVAGAGDLDYLADNGGGGGGIRTTNVHFHNQFSVQGGGGGSNGGIDVRSAVRQIADQLEDEMKRRMARSN